MDQFVSPQSTSVFRKILPFLSILVLVTGLIVGVPLLKHAGRVATVASANLVDLSFSTPKTTLTPGEQFVVSVLIDAKAYSVSAASVFVTVPSNLVKIVAISPGPYFTQSLPPNYSQPLIITNPGTTDPNVASLVVGSACPNVLPTPPPATTPCVVKTGAGVLAILTLQILPTATAGAVQVSFDTTSGHTEIAALNQIASVLGNAPALPLTISVSASPLPTPTLTPRPSQSPSPTPSNHPPTLSPTTLPNATINQPYSVNLVGTDPDTSDTLEVKISGLPSGLASSCSRLPTVRNQVTCVISGTPTQVGTFNISVRLQDGSGANVNNRLNLVVQ